MSLENPTNPNETMDRSESAMETARELIAENEVLRNNARVQEVSENDFITEDGRKLDPRNFIAAMLDFINSQKPGSASAETVTNAIEQYKVDGNLRVVETKRPKPSEGAEQVM